eukprot:scaffold29503_cov53-Phaeocystis_antarctica.AAC.6
MKCVIPYSYSRLRASAYDRLWSNGCRVHRARHCAQGRQGDNLVREARRRHKEDRHDPAYRAQLERALRGADAAASQR